MRNGTSTLLNNACTTCNYRYMNAKIAHVHYLSLKNKTSKDYACTCTCMCVLMYTYMYVSSSLLLLLLLMLLLLLFTFFVCVHNTLVMFLHFLDQLFHQFQQSTYMYTRREREGA